MNIFYLIILVITIFSGFFIAYLFFKKELEKKFIEKEKEDSLNIFQNLLNDLRKDMVEKLESSLTTTAKTEEILRIVENYVNELIGLKQILAGPKSRGILGEKILEDILKELPNKAYEIQYPIGFNKVDAVLKINDFIIPIDAKFPYSNYIKFLEVHTKEEKEKLKKELIRDIKNYIESISKKYVEPLRETVEFAIMYIPAEGLFYEILDKDYSEIWEFAKEKSVFITSPKTFEVISASIVLSLKKQEFAKNVKEIIFNIIQLEKDLIEIESKFETTYKQLNNSFNNLQELSRMLNRFIINYKNLLSLEKRLNEKVKSKSLI